jgi:RNA polymerase sigma-70 factor (ECF subfamily)
MSPHEAVPAARRAAPPPWSATIDTGPRAAGTSLSGSPENDRVVVKAVLDGNRDAFRVLVEREAASVIRACQRILGDRHEAEDVAQEAFVIAYRSLGAWRGDGPFGAWLTRIAVRDAVRRASRRREVAWVSPELPGSGRAPEILAVGASRAAIDPAQAALHAERTADVRLAVSRLDEPYRETVALRFFGELSLNEIAAETGRPLATVKTHLRRGLLRLRERLDEGGLR